MANTKFTIKGKILHFYNTKFFVFEDVDGNEFEVLAKDEVSVSAQTEVELIGYIENGQYYANKIVPKPTTVNGAIEMLERLFTKKQAGEIANHFNGASGAVELINSNWTKFCDIAIEIKGIGDKTLNSALQKLQKEILDESIDEILTPFEFSFEDKLLVTQYLNGAPLAMLSTNPYELYHVGVSFDKLDLLALHYFKFARKHPIRIKSAILAVLDNSANEGHLFLYKVAPKSYDGTENDNHKTLFGELRTLLKLYEHDKLFDECLYDLAREYHVVIDKLDNNEIVYGIKYFNQENQLTKSLFKFIHPIDIKDKDIQDAIEKFEEKNFKLHQLQRDAVVLSLKNQCSILTGPPGSGKTTIIEVIIQSYQEMFPDNVIACAAPTGKAADRMSETIESTGLSATTIHRLLKPTINKGKMEFLHNRKNRLNYDFIVVDEISMVDYELMQSLLDACNKNTKLLFVGDEHQLSSISPGSLLLEMINSNVIPKTILTKIFRQKGESSILKMSHSIRANGTMSYDKADDFEMSEYDTPAKVHNQVVKFALDRKFKKNLIDWTILTSWNVGPFGVQTLNRRIQEAYNPQSQQTPEIMVSGEVFREGDKVIQLVNDPTLGIVNGSVGRIRKISVDYVYIDFIKDEDWVMVPKGKMCNIQLAYAMTIHKSQGSEYEDVCLVLPSAHESSLNRSLVYTGLTRAKKYLEIVGVKEVIDRALANEAALLQYSALAKRLQIEQFNANKK